MAIRLVLGVIEQLALRDSVGVTELAKALETTKARVYRHLRTLLDQGYAVQDADSDRYAAGPPPHRAGRIAALTPFDSIVRLARPTMMRLSREAGHTINLSLVYGESVSIVETLQGSSIIGVVMRTNAPMPLHSTAAGKLQLAERLARLGLLPDGPLEKFTDNTITDPRIPPAGAGAHPGTGLGGGAGRNGARHQRPLGADPRPPGRAGRDDLDPELDPVHSAPAPARTDRRNGGGSTRDFRSAGALRA